MRKSLYSISAITFLVLPVIAFAQIPSGFKPQQSVRIDRPDKSMGPIGVGWLKLGMETSDLKPNIDEGGTSLTAPLIAPSFRPRTLPEGDTLLTSKLKIPFSNTPLNLFVVTRESKVITLNLGMGSNIDSAKIFNEIKSAITDKYGEPNQTSEMRKDKECIYRNGASIKLPDGENSYKWYSKATETVWVETALIDTANAKCAENLAKDDPQIIRNFSMVIRYVGRNSDIDSTEKSKGKTF